MFLSTVERLCVFRTFSSFNIITGWSVCTEIEALLKKK